MEWLAPLILRLEGAGVWAPVWFIVAYVAASVVLAPAFLLTVAAGAVFGLWRGGLFVFTGAVLGSTTVYWLARVASPWVERRLDRTPALAAVRQAVVRDGVWVMFLLRLSPVVPYGPLNYALALSGVRYRHYLVASVGMLPAIMMYVYYGKVIGDVTRIAAGIAPPRGPMYYVLLAVGLAATVVATTLVTKAARRQMESARR